MNMWRPEGWVNPHKEQIPELFGRIFEEGADAGMRVLWEEMEKQLKIESSFSDFRVIREVDFQALRAKVMGE